MSDALLQELGAILGPTHVLTGEAAAPYLTDWRKLVQGRASTRCTATQTATR